MTARIFARLSLLILGLLTLALAACATEADREAPVDLPTAAPTSAPTPAPTSAPTTAPTSAPTSAPTASRTPASTAEPTEEPTPEPHFPYDALLEDLAAAGVHVEGTAEEVAQAFFTPAGRLLAIEGAEVQIFVYEHEATAAAEAAQVSANGSTIGGTMVTWIDEPHFYRRGEVIALYVGQDEAVLAALEAALGPQFAGAEKPPEVVPLPLGRLAFVGGRLEGDTFTSDIFLLDESGARNLTDSPADELYPVWSPDGTRLAYVSNVNGDLEIYVMNADGTGQTRLTNNPADDRAPTWSPDGARIAFSSDRDGNYEIYVMNADGTGVTRLTDHPDFDLGPAWSPDGTQIAFVSLRGGSNGIYVMNADGRDLKPLAAGRDADRFDPVWSPNGAQIAFIRGDALYLMNADGSDQQPLGASRLIQARPAWSPDGQWIAFAGGESITMQSARLYALSVQGRTLIRLQLDEDGSYATSPAWQR